MLSAWWLVAAPRRCPVAAGRRHRVPRCSRQCLPAARIAAALAVLVAPVASRSPPPPLPSPPSSPIRSPCPRSPPRSPTPDRRSPRRCCSWRGGSSTSPPERHCRWWSPSGSPLPSPTGPCPPIAGAAARSPPAQSPPPPPDPIHLRSLPIPRSPPPPARRTSTARPPLVVAIGFSVAPAAACPVHCCCSAVRFVLPAVACSLIGAVARRLSVAVGCRLVGVALAAGSVPPQARCLLVGGVGGDPPLVFGRCPVAVAAGVARCLSSAARSAPHASVAGGGAVGRGGGQTPADERCR